MVEAMFHQTPEYFKTYRKDFRYFVTEVEPIFNMEGKENIAYCKHSPETDDFCNVRNVEHYHVLLHIQFKNQKESNTDKGCIVPCLYTTFWLLLYKGQKLKTTGDIMERLLRAVEYNLLHNIISLTPAVRKKVPLIQMKLDKSSQTEHLSSSTVDRVARILNSEHCGLLFACLDILIDGYGSINQPHFVLKFDENKN